MDTPRSYSRSMMLLPFVLHAIAAKIFVACSYRMTLVAVAGASLQISNVRCCCCWPIGKCTQADFLRHKRAMQILVCIAELAVNLCTAFSCVLCVLHCFVWFYYGKKHACMHEKAPSVLPFHYTQFRTSQQNYCC